MEKELVWAKMRGFPPWPGKICIPKPNLAKSASKPKGAASKWIFFFGTKNYSWIEETNLKPYLEHRDAIVKTLKTSSIKEAVKRIDEYLNDPVKYSENGPTVKEDNEDTNKTFDDLRRSRGSESPENQTPKPPAKKSKTKKSEPKKRGSDNGLSEETSKKRPRHSSPKQDDQKIDSSTDYLPPPRRQVNSAHILINRPPPEEPPQIIMDISQSQKLQNIIASKKIFGFLGVGIMGSGIVKNLLISGHEVYIWNRDPSKSRKLEELGAKVAMTPCDVAEQVDIIFSCVSDPLASKELVFGNCGIISSSQHFDGKGYVEMTGLDGDSSQDIADAIVSKGGRYLEAQMQGSRNQAEDGTLIILAAGDRSLFDECQSCFKAMGKNSFFLGDVGNASKMYLILQLLAGVTLGGLAEAFALADRAGLQQKDVLEVFTLTTMASPYMIQKAEAIIKQEYPPHQPLMHMQKDLRLALSLSEQIEQGMPITAATNEVFKHAKRNGYSEHDASAVYVRSRI